MALTFDIECRRCSRLAKFLEEVRIAHPDYYCRPVASFGAEKPSLLIVGLAPGMHGANRTGRPFTGDFAGILLYQTLHKFRLATTSNPLDEAGGANPTMALRRAMITNAVKCLPPDNKPLPVEVGNCNAYLRAELESLQSCRVIIALGVVAHGAVLRALGERARNFPFSHGAQHRVHRFDLFDSYHCSRYNTQTRRLTPAMFEAVFARAVAKL